MKTFLTLFLPAICTLSLALNQACACGYGLFDADIEQFVSGDAKQAGEALIRLEQRGIGALREISRYQARVENSHQNYTRYLDHLRSDPALLPEDIRGHFEKMSDETREREIQRAETFLKWNVKRSLKIQFLDRHIGSSGFVGESLQFGRVFVG